MISDFDKALIFRHQPCNLGTLQPSNLSTLPPFPPIPPRRQQKRHGRQGNFWIFAEQPNDEQQHNQQPHQDYAGQHQFPVGLLLEKGQQKQQLPAKREQDQRMGKSVRRGFPLKQDLVFHFVHKGGIALAPFQVTKKEGEQKAGDGEFGHINR